MQSLTAEYIELLAEKKLNGTITSEEQVVLEQWLNRKPAGHIVWNSDDKDEQMLRDRLLKRIQADAGIVSSATSKSRLLYRYRQIAATVLLLMIGGLGYFLFFSKDNLPVIATSESKIKDMNVSPGRSGAILTLSNGEQIVLDSLESGTIAVQGDRSLVKQNGKLTYRGDNKSLKVEGTEILYNTLTTPRGREFQIILADGTKVWLNAASSISYPTAFTGAERKVTVTGEVYFDVVKDSRKPFIVSVHEAEIKVLGTRFDVMAYPDEKEIKTTLLEGSVSVSKGKNQVVIRPGQQAGFSNQSNQIHVKEVDIDQAVAWINGKLSLNNLEVEAIMRNLSRWYDVDVEFEGPISHEHFWGLINRNVGLKEILKVLRANGINANIKGHKVIVSSN